MFLKNLLLSLIGVSVVGLSSASAKESYVSIEGNVKLYQNRVEEKRKKIDELAEKKATLHDETQIRGVLDEMVTEAKELKKSFVDFQKEKKRLNYEFPSRGDETERKYRHFELQIVEELNSLSNIDLRLKGLMSKIQKTYDKPPEVVEKEEKKKRQQKEEAGVLESKDSKEKNESKEEKDKSGRPVLSY